MRGGEIRQTNPNLMRQNHGMIDDRFFSDEVLSSGGAESIKDDDRQRRFSLCSPLKIPRRSKIEPLVCFIPKTKKAGAGLFGAAWRHTPKFGTPNTHTEPLRPIGTRTQTKTAARLRARARVRVPACECRDARTKRGADSADTSETP